MDLFNDAASDVGFLGGRSLEDVQTSDRIELENIGGSLAEIAERMEYFQSRIFHVIGNTCYSRKSWEEGKLFVADANFTNGLQECPFMTCTFLGTADVLVRNKATGRELIVNDITIHLARQHNLLEKGNKYGISAKEFYVHFM